MAGFEVTIEVQTKLRAASICVDIHRTACPDPRVSIQRPLWAPLFANILRRSQHLSYSFWAWILSIFQKIISDVTQRLCATKVANVDHLSSQFFQ